MRILIYLLALLSGLSAAEAARPLSAADAVAAEQALTASVVRTRATPARQFSQQVPQRAPDHIGQPEPQTAPVALATPVLRHDIARQ